MSKLTSSVLPAALLLGSLLAGRHAAAQTTPAWTAASSTGSYVDHWPKRVMDAAGNVYEAGHFSAATSVGNVTLNTRGGNDGYLAKFTPAGTVAWVRHFGSAGEDLVVDLALDAAGDVYIVGGFQHSIQLGGGQTLSAGTYQGSKAFVARYTPQGTPVWARQSDESSPNPATPYCFPGAAATALSVDAGGTVSVSGWYGSIDGFGLGGQHLPIPTNLGTRMPYFLARLSAATGAASSLTVSFYSDRSTGGGALYPPFLVNEPGGGLYIVSQYYMAPSFPTGPSLPAPASVSILVARYTAAGSLDWVRSFGGPDFDEVARVAVNAAGELFIAGSYRQSLGFGSTTLPGQGSDDAFLVKYSAQGSELWAQSLASSGPDFFHDLRLDRGGNPYVTGAFSNQARIGATTLTSGGSQDVVVAAYTPQGQLRWVQQAGGPNEDRGLAFNFTPQGNLRLFGLGSSGARFGTLAPALGSYTGFMAELAGTALATRAGADAALGLYPNPATDGVSLPALAAGTRVQLLDALGRVVREAAPAATRLSVRGLAPGLYTLRATQPDGRRLTGQLAVE